MPQEDHEFELRVVPQLPHHEGAGDERLADTPERLEDEPSVIPSAQLAGHINLALGWLREPQGHPEDEQEGNEVVLHPLEVLLVLIGHPVPPSGVRG